MALGKARDADAEAARVGVAAAAVELPDVAHEVRRVPEGVARRGPSPAVACGRSPASARMFDTPLARHCSRTWLISGSVWQTHVRCGTVSSFVSRRIRSDQVVRQVARRRRPRRR